MWIVWIVRSEGGSDVRKTTLDRATMLFCHLSGDFITFGWIIITIKVLRESAEPWCIGGVCGNPRGHSVRSSY